MIYNRYHPLFACMLSSTWNASAIYSASTQKLGNHWDRKRGWSLFKRWRWQLDVEQRPRLEVKCLDPRSLSVKCQDQEHLNYNLCKKWFYEGMKMQVKGTLTKKQKFHRRSNLILVEQHVWYAISHGELSRSFRTHQVSVDHLDLRQKHGFKSSRT